MNNKIKGLSDYVIVHSEKQAEDSLRLSSGLELWLDNTHEDKERKLNFARIVAVPQYMTDNYPVFQDSATKEVYTHKVLPVEAQVGNIAYFDWTVLDESRSIGDNLYWLLYSEIYAVERMEWVMEFNNTIERPTQRSIIQAIGGYVLINPEIKEADDVVNGIPVYLNKLGLAEVADEPVQETNSGTIAFIGKNYGGHSPSLPAGTKIKYNAEWGTAMVKIHGKEYHVIRQHQILAEVEA